MPIGNGFSFSNSTETKYNTIERHSTSNCSLNSHYHSDTLKDTYKI